MKTFRVDGQVYMEIEVDGVLQERECDIYINHPHLPFEYIPIINDNEKIIRRVGADMMIIKLHT